jgi:hypothetical protein
MIIWKIVFIILLYYKWQIQKEPTQNLMNSHSKLSRQDILKKQWRSTSKWIILHNVWTDCVNV